jgi:hypothetical protein
LEPGVLFVGDQEILAYVQSVWDKDVANASFSQKLELALFRSGKHLPPETAARLYELFTPQMIGVTVFVLALWGAGHFFGYGEAIDLILLVAAAYMTGQELSLVLAALWRFFEGTYNATTYGEIDQASQEMAVVISKIGIDLLIALIVKCGKRAVSGAPAKTGTVDGNITAAPSLAAKTASLPSVPPKVSIPVVSHVDPFNPKAVSRAATKAGLTDGQAARLQRIAMRRGLRVVVRPAGDAAAFGRLQGFTPKWEDLKMKTISDLDIKLGAPAKGVGQPGHFMPKVPEGGLAALQRTEPALYARYQQRVQFFTQFDSEVQEMVRAGDIILENGIIRDRIGRPICGDNDFYEFTTPSGKRLHSGEAAFDDVMADLQSPNEAIMAQHPPHMNWDAPPELEWIKQDIINRHQSGEPLYEFREDGSIWELTNAGRAPGNR